METAGLAWGRLLLMFFSFSPLLLGPSSAATEATEAAAETAAAPGENPLLSNGLGSPPQAFAPPELEPMLSSSSVDSSSQSGEAAASLVEIMRTVRGERTMMRIPQGKRLGGALGRLNTDMLMALAVTAAVLLFAFRVIGRKYAPDELTLKMSRQARWFNPQHAAYSANDGHVYVVSLDFRGLERVVLPKRYSQHEKENLIALFERALQYFETVPPGETSGYLIENWSPAEKVPPIDIRVVRLPYGQVSSMPPQ